MKKKWLISFIILISFFVFANPYAELEIFAQVLNTIQSHYIKPLKVKKLVHGAIQGLLGELDPHSQFFNPQTFKRFKNKNEGYFYGVGIELEKKQGFLMVISVLPYSPAKRAGFKEGDKILAINKKAVKNLTLAEFFQTLQKEKNKVYRIAVLRKNKPLSIEVKPGTIKMQPVQFKKLEKDLAYMRIFQFSKNTFFKVNKALESQSLKGLILDLRSNPGGLLEEAIKVSDLFLDKGPIVSIKTRTGQNTDSFSANLSTTLPSFPLVVLINEYSASASEIVAGALKDHKRAIVMGRKSFGKGSVQNIFPLPRNYALKLTVGEYYTPSGKSIHKKGIKPHILLPPPKDDLSLALKNVLGDSEVKSALKKLKTL